MRSPASVSSGGAGMDAGLDDAVGNCGGADLALTVEGADAVGADADDADGGLELAFEEF